MKLRRLILPLASALAIIATPAAASAATTAHAATPAAATAHVAAAPGHVTPFEAQGCSGDACIHVSTPSNGKVTIHGCAWKTTVSGHV
jgi:hypothetical protein